MKIRVGIVGSTGYAGQVLLSILLKHKNVDVRFLTSNSFAGESFCKIYGKFRGATDLRLISNEEGKKILGEIDLVFLALPHLESMKYVKFVRSTDYNIKIIDLSADFRLDTKEEFKTWYGEDHLYNEGLDEFVYGLSEVNKEIIKGSSYIANPGCYPTSILLGLAPLLINKIISNENIIIDSKSGASGAGRGLKSNLMFCELDENLYPYGIGNHRHTGEIENIISKLYGVGSIVQFTPNLVPIKRGIISTIYCDLKSEVDETGIREIYNEYYRESCFVRMCDDIPSVGDVAYTNHCDITFRIDKRTNRIIIVSTIDNLIKGASGQAVQNMNLMYGLKENEGLDLSIMFP